VDGKVILKPGAFVHDKAKIQIKGGEPVFVSRGGDKLNAALDYFHLNVSKKVCLDVGASTGGFTDCLLKRGASKIYAVDNGKGQLAEVLQKDKRVISIEETDIKNVTSDWFNEPITFVTVDISFISLTKVLEPISKVLSADAQLVCLVKPQFEAGKSHLSKRGIVRDPKIRWQTVDKVCTIAQQIGLNYQGVLPYPQTLSPKDKNKKNQEFLVYFCRKRDF